MRIGIDLTGIWRQGTGIFVYAKELARELLLLDKENKYTLFFGREIHPEFRDLVGQFRPVVVPIHEEFLSKQVLMAGLCNTIGLDLIHFPAFPPPVACFRSFIWTLHDATPWRYPDTMDLKGRLYFRWVGARAVKASKLIITVSNEARKDITTSLRIAEGKVRVIYEGIDHVFRREKDDVLLNSVRRRYGLPERFILAVGTLEPRKNLRTLIRAYREMAEVNGNKLGLVLAGRLGWKPADLEDYLYGEDKRITVTGFVPQCDLVALYSLAEVFVLPSLYEGFGFPPLEAMACGCPVIVSNRGSLPEVVGDAAILIDPENVESMVHAIRAVESNVSLRADLVRRGLDRVKLFSWKTAAAKTLEIYREAAMGGVVA